MPIFDDDIVRDILTRAVRAAQEHGGFGENLAIEIERQVKIDWGGTEPYIRHGVADRIAERNDKIQRCFDDGCRNMQMLAGRFGLSVKQIRRIVER